MRNICAWCGKVMNDDRYYSWIDERVTDAVIVKLEIYNCNPQCGIDIGEFIISNKPSSAIVAWEDIHPHVFRDE